MFYFIDLLRLSVFKKSDMVTGPAPSPHFSLVALPTTIPLPPALSPPTSSYYFL